MAESARAGPTDLNGAGPSSPRLPPPSPPKADEAMDVDDPENGPAKMDANGDTHEPVPSSVNASTTTDKPPQSLDAHSVSTTAVTSTMSRMDPPPDTMRPPSRGDTPNGVHFASNPDIVPPDPIAKPDQAMSPAQSIAGSASTSKSRNKRKRGPASSARRASTIDKDRPPHYLGPDSQIIRCICGTQSDTLTAQCDTCGAWEHALCFGYPEDPDALPDNFYCELCVPRPVDRDKARALQEANMELPVLALATEPDPVKPRPKGRRQKSEMGANDGNDPSPTTAKPPSLPQKPKRRQPGAKPRSAKASITDTAPSPAAAAASSRAVASEAGKELDDPFFREPWTMQFSPLVSNLPKGAKGQSALRKLHAEWRDTSSGDEGNLDSTERHARQTPNGHERTPSVEPDLSVLAPPVPPISLVGPDIDALGAQITVKPVRDSVNFLPNQYEGDLPPEDLSHPANYAVYAKNEIPAGSFIGEFRGEVGPIEAYRKDIYNQYATLGVPKPHVRFVGPPINLSVDARCWGTRLRFIRSSCHPNAVIRLIRWRKSESDSPQLGFGVFANTAIRPRGEITLAWDWDDHHLVHSLERIIEAASGDDAGTISTRHETTSSLAGKCESVLLAMYGTFATCACSNLHHCAFHQMKYIVDHREETSSLGSAQGRHPVSDLGELIGAVRGFRRQTAPIARVRRRSPGWGMRPSTTPAVPSAEREVEAVSEAEEEVGQESMDVDAQIPTTVEPSTNLVESPDIDVEMTPPPEETQPEADISMDSQRLVTLPTIPESSPLHIAPPMDTDVTPLSRVVTHQELLSRVFPSTSVASADSSVLSAAPSQEARDVMVSMEAHEASYEAVQSAMLGVEMENGNESDATTATVARSNFSDSGSDLESEDERPDTPPRRSAVPEAKKGKVKKNGVLKKDKPISVHLQDLFENDTGLPELSPALSAMTDLPGDLDNYDDAEIIAEPGEDTPPRPKAVVSAPRDRSPRSAEKEEVYYPVKSKRGRGRGRGMPGSRVASKVSRPRAESVESVKEPTPVPVKELTPEPVKEPTPEPVKEPTPEPVKEPTPPPPSPPKHVVSMADYVRQAKQRREEASKPAEPPAPPTPAVVETPTPPVPEVLNWKTVRVDGGIPGFKHLSPVKPADPLPVTNGHGSSASPATRQAELDNSRFNMFDHLPTHGSASQTPALETPTNGSASTTPGLGLTKGDYFPQQPTSQISSSYVPRASRPSYVPRAQGSITRTSETPSIDDYLPRAGSSSAQSQTAPLPRIPSGSSSYVPRPSPLSDHVPLPPALSQSTSSSSSNQQRISPYRPPLNLPAEPSIPPPAIREAPPHATFRPPTGPKVPPKGPRTSGGSASGAYVPPRDRDRDWNARDRERERDQERERERDRDRDREPVSPRASFGVGSARGGAPVPVPFHRPPVPTYRPRGRGFRRGRGGLQ